MPILLKLFVKKFRSWVVCPCFLHSTILSVSFCWCPLDQDSWLLNSHNSLSSSKSEFNLERLISNHGIVSNALIRIIYLYWQKLCWPKLLILEILVFSTLVCFSVLVFNFHALSHLLPFYLRNSWHCNATYNILL